MDSNERSQGMIGALALKPKLSILSRLLNFARKKTLGTAAGVILMIVALVAIFPNVVASQNPYKANYRNTLNPPSTKFLMGTDQLGRDVLSRVVRGARISMTVGFASVGLALVAGTIWGLASGYFGGRADLLIQRIMDSILSLPLLIAAMVIVAILGGSLINVIVAIAFVMQASVNRVVRASVLAIRENAYIEAAKAIGAGDLRILLHYVLPNIMAPIIVIASVNLGSAILQEASLSFLGLGIQPPEPSWGGMLSSEGRQFFERAPWLAIFPGVALSITVLAFNLLGDSIRDALDPRLRT